MVLEFLPDTARFKATAQGNADLLKSLQLDRVDFTKHMVLLVSAYTPSTMPDQKFEVASMRLTDDGKSMVVLWKVSHSPSEINMKAEFHHGEVLIVEKFGGTVKFERAR